MQQRLDSEIFLIKECLDSLLNCQRHEINRFYNLFQAERCYSLINCLLEDRRMFFWSGVGKSGYVAGKIAGTLMSLGEKSTYFSIADALHGDLGLFHPGDAVCFLSKSGESKEILNVVPYLKTRDVVVCSITSSGSSALALVSDISVLIPSLKELCPFNLVPTISSELQLMVGDLIVSAVQRIRKLTLADYGSNHPQGQIGQRANVKVIDVMIPLDKVPVCFPHNPLGEVISVFSSGACGCLILINDKGELFGIFTDGDLRRALQKFGDGLLKKRMSELVRSSPRFVTKSAVVNEAVDKMEDEISPVMVLPVVNSKWDKRLIGLVRMHDLVRLSLM
ncbi:MAG: SIS domain-containing protein [Victivallaceae bacterium]